MKYQDLIEASHSFEEPEGSSYAYYSGIVQQLIHSPNATRLGQSNTRAKHTLKFGNWQITTDSADAFKHYQRLWEILKRALHRAIKHLFATKFDLFDPARYDLTQVTPVEFQVLYPLIPPASVQNWLQTIAEQDRAAADRIATNLLSSDEQLRTAAVYATTFRGSRWPAFEQRIEEFIKKHKTDNAFVDHLYSPCADYCVDVGMRWPAIEQALLNPPRQTTRVMAAINNYALRVVAGKWPEYEQLLKQWVIKDISHASNPGYLIVPLFRECEQYCTKAVCGRVPFLEDVMMTTLKQFIIKHPGASSVTYLLGTMKQYANELMGGKWPEVEKVIQDSGNQTLIASYGSTS